MNDRDGYVADVSDVESDAVVGDDVDIVVGAVNVTVVIEFVSGVDVVDVVDTWTCHKEK